MICWDLVSDVNFETFLILQISIRADTINTVQYYEQ